MYFGSTLVPSDDVAVELSVAELSVAELAVESPVAAELAGAAVEAVELAGLESADFLSSEQAARVMANAIPIPTAALTRCVRRCCMVLP